MSKSKVQSRTVTYKLKHPFKWGSEEISEIEFSRPKGKHLKGLNPNNLTISDVIQIASNVCEHPPPVFDEMDSTDYLAIAGLVGDFLDSGRSAGKQA